MMKAEIVSDYQKAINAIPAPMRGKKVDEVQAQICETYVIGDVEKLRLLLAEAAI
jgi:hypothetical protein